MKAERGCWTCKQRKTKCDRILPSCYNCKRLGKVCLGYGIRLHWPSHHDGRRRDGGFVLFDPPENLTQRSQAYGRHFLNVTFTDVVACRVLDPYSALVLGPTRPLTLHPIMIGQDALFMSYYQCVIAPLVSATRVRNGFRTDLVQMVLSHDGIASQALRNSMMAVAAFHHGGSAAALLYKTKAVRCLLTSLDQEQVPRSIKYNAAQFATALMLCLYSVFDETDGYWATHLDGAKSMLQELYPDHQHHITPDFLFTWFLYHEVLACFTQPIRQARNCIDILALLETSSCDPTLILGPFGCSLQTIALIHRVNKIRLALKRNEIEPSSLELILDRLQLEHSLHNLTQRLHPEEEASNAAATRTNTLAMAELYQIGVLLYLRHVVPLPGDNQLTAATLNEAFHIFDRLEVATHPWPVFMVASDCQTDEQRMCILKVLDLMDNVRNIGNIRTMRSFIESCWKHHDLHADLADPRRTRCWESIARYEVAVPWFI